MSQANASPKAHQALDKLARLRAREAAAERRWSYYAYEGNKTDDRLHGVYIRAQDRVIDGVRALLKLVDCDGYV